MLLTPVIEEAWWILLRLWRRHRCLLRSPLGSRHCLWRLPSHRLLSRRPSSPYFLLLWDGESPQRLQRRRRRAQGSHCSSPSYSSSYLFYHSTFETSSKRPTRRTDYSSTVHRWAQTVQSTLIIMYKATILQCVQKFVILPRPCFSQLFVYES